MDNLTIREITNEELEKMYSIPCYEEDKEQCIEMLFLSLKTTRAFHNCLTSMGYIKKQNGDEVVECRFVYRDGRKELLSINVTADSCVAMIHDVFTRLYRDYI